MNTSYYNPFALKKFENVSDFQKTPGETFFIW